jgi:hypothetical protein
VGGHWDMARPKSLLGVSREAPRWSLHSEAYAHQKLPTLHEPLNALTRNTDHRESPPAPGSPTSGTGVLATSNYGLWQVSKNSLAEQMIREE